MGLFSRFVSMKGKGTKRRGAARGRARKKHSLRRKIFTRVTIVAGVFGVIGAGAWFITSEAGSLTGQWIERETINQTAKAGFKVENLLVDGRENTDSSALMGLMNVQKGDPIFSFNPTEVKKLIEQLSWIEKAHVERRLPDTIYVRLYERVPVALWKEGERLVVIDKDGVILTDQNISKYAGLPMVAGDMANTHVMGLVDMLIAEPLILERLDVAQWIENRRWNLHLKDGKVVILPENDKEFALSRLVKKHKEEAVLDKAITSIDARDPSRFIVETQRGKVQDYKNAPEAQQTSL